VNVGAYIATKQRMLAAHTSQLSWVVKQHGIDDYAGAMDAWTRTRGESFGVAYAEGFRQYRCHPYPGTKLLQELVGDALLWKAAYT